jgi:hypothetical protein
MKPHFPTRLDAPTTATEEGFKMQSRSAPGFCITLQPFLGKFLDEVFLHVSD